jgi:hypothetical protein
MRERGEIQNEDGREDGWMKEIWKKKAVGVERKILFFLDCYLYF